MKVLIGLVMLGTMAMVPAGCAPEGTTQDSSGKGNVLVDDSSLLEASDSLISEPSFDSQPGLDAASTGLGSEVGCPKPKTPQLPLSTELKRVSPHSYSFPAQVTVGTRCKKTRIAVSDSGDTVVGGIYLDEVTHLPGDFELFTPNGKPVRTVSAPGATDEEMVRFGTDYYGNSGFMSFDLGGDGTKELLVQHRNKVLIMKPNGRILWSMEFEYVRRIDVLDDITGDGKSEFLVAGINATGYGRHIYSNDGGLLHSYFFSGGLGDIYQNLASVGDMNSDGVTDYAFFVVDSFGGPDNERVEIYSGADHGLLSKAYTASMVSDEDWDLRDSPLAGEDLNGDGVPELVHTGLLCPSLYLDCSTYLVAFDGATLMNQGALEEVTSGEAFPSVILWPQRTSEARALGDLDGDGRQEYLMSSSTAHESSGEIRILSFKQQASGALGLTVLDTFVGSHEGAELGRRGTSLVVEDLNEDGMPDLVTVSKGATPESRELTIQALTSFAL